MKAPTKTVLVVRLSSLGDLILSLAFVESLPPGVAVDWVTTHSFSFLLEGHPRIRKLYLYDKKTGLLGWLRLIGQLARTPYDARVDLHRNLRSFLARVIFLLHGQRTHVLNKQRFQTQGYFLLKRLWPRFLRPKPYWQRFAEVAIRTCQALRIPGAEPRPPVFPVELDGLEKNNVWKKYGIEPQKYWVVMPSSRWSSKEWGAERYAETLIQWSRKRPELKLLVLGRPTDRSCVELVRKLKERSAPVLDSLQEEDFRVTAFLIQNACAYLGGDTGLAHLAEAVGTPALVLFGPTQPEVGFGPWRPESQGVSSQVWCSPCSKDGRICYRLDQPYACFQKLQTQTVIQSMESIQRPKA